MKITLLLTFLPFICFALGAFQDVAQQSGIDFVAVFSDDVFPTQGGVAWFDYNADGHQDLYLTGGAAEDALFENNGDGTFTDVTNLAGLEVMDTSINTMGVVTGDIDNDGFREIFVTTEDSDLNRMFYNNGDGTFSDISVPAGIMEGGNSASATFGDLNKDGFIDLYVTNWCVEMYNMETHDTFLSMQNYLYLNNGDLTFTEASYDYGVADEEGCGLAATFSDFDNDGDLDIVLGNDFGPLPGNSNNILFENQFPADTFLDVSVPTGFDFEMFSMGTAIGDYNEDGYLDYYLTNEGTDALFSNNNGQFVHQTIDAGINNQFVVCLDQQEFRPTYGWGCGFLDYNDDTYLDLLVVNGDLHWQYPRPCVDETKLFRGSSNSTFTDVSQNMGVADTYMSRGGAFADYDNDGDLDILLGITDTLTGNKNVKLFQNNDASYNWVSFNTIGVNGNCDGFGSRITASIGNRRLIREVDGGSSFNSHHSSIVHFGLGTAESIDTL